jgi:hypothetical protein
LVQEARVSTAAGRGVEIYSRNRYYWQLDGKPVLLLGGSPRVLGVGDVGVFHMPDLEEHLDALVSVGGNWMRCLMSGREDPDSWPFAWTGQGYDLDRWNDAYWQKFELFLRETRARRIVTDCEMWATFDYFRRGWELNPFNPKNNRNYTFESSGLPAEAKSHPVLVENSFFRTIPEEDNNQIVLGYQRRFVDKVLSHSLQFDHVLYCIDNETSASEAWATYWARHIRSRAAEAGRAIYITEMWERHDIEDPQHSSTIDHPELYTHVEISQNNHQVGPTHYSKILAIRNRIASHPRPLSNVKIYGSREDHFGGTEEALRRFWRNIFGGAASARFHEQHLGFGALAQRMIRGARAVTGAFDLFACEPRPDLLEVSPGSEAYCLANPGTAYAVYFTDGGSAWLSTGHSQEEYHLQWFNIGDGRWEEHAEVTRGARILLQTPTQGHWVAMMRHKATTPTEG